MKSFEAVGGFRMELVAHEPMVQSPVAGAFDENGNLYVAELIDYPYLPKKGSKPLGRVRLLISRVQFGTISSSSTSNVRAAFPGIPGRPWAPYARS